MNIVNIEMHKKLCEIGIYAYELDTVIDLLRIKYNVIIYNSAPPFVDPTTRKIVYAFSVKYCNTHIGWNGRIFVYFPKKWITNIYEAKRRAVKAAINWIKNNKQLCSK